MPGTEFVTYRLIFLTTILGSDYFYYSNKETVKDYTSGRINGISLGLSDFKVYLLSVMPSEFLDFFHFIICIGTVPLLIQRSGSFQTYIRWLLNFNSVQFSHSVVSNSLQPHRLQHARLPCSSPTPRACSDSCPSSWWCHPTISSSVVPFSSCLQSSPASESFLMSRFFTVAKVLALQLQHQSFQWIFRTDFL